MSSSESSLQHEKLLPSTLCIDSSSPGGPDKAMWLISSIMEEKFPLGKSEGVVINRNGFLGKSEGVVINRNGLLQDSKPEVNPDICYSWLQVNKDDPGDDKKSRHGSQSSLSSSDSSSLPMPQAPDGGWGWFVVFGAFTVTLICDGLSYCFGVFYAELLVQFGESHSKTSLVGSIFYGFAMILGPIASALTTRFGCRTMTIFGGIIASIGLFLSSFATSIEMLCITFSTIVGIGFSFCYITSVVVVAFYFDKRRALATGLAVCGTGVGTFAFAPLMDYLIAEYGWRGMLVILSGLNLNLVVCGMLFRPLQFTEGERWEMLLQEFNKIPYSREDLELFRNRYPSESSDYHSDEEVFEEEARTLSVLSLPTYVNIELLSGPSIILMEALKNSKNPHHTLQRYMKNAMLQLDQHYHDSPKEDEQGSPVDDLTLSTKSTIQKDKNIEDVKSEPDETYCSMPSSFLDDCRSKTCMSPICLPCKPNEETMSHFGAISPKSPDMPHTVSCMASINGKLSNGKTELKAKLMNGKIYTVPQDEHKENNHHKRIEFSGMSNILTDKGCEMERKSVVKRLSGVHIGRHNALGIHLPLYRTDIFYRRLLRNVPLHKPCMLGTSCPELLESVAPETKRNVIAQKVAGFLRESCEMMKSMIDLRLFLNPFFFVFLTSNFIYYFWDDVPYIYASDHAMNNGVEPHKASFLLSVLGIFNTIGQVVFGFVGDMDINILNVYAVISAIAGLFVLLVPLMTSYISMAAMYGLFGFFISVSYPLTTVLLVNYLGVAKLTNAYGLLMLIQGIANLGGPPFAGWVSDNTGNYNAAYYMSGIFYMVSGIMMFLVYIPKCIACVRSRKNILNVKAEDV